MLPKRLAIGLSLAAAAAHPLRLVTARDQDEVRARVRAFRASAAYQDTGIAHCALQLRDRVGSGGGEQRATALHGGGDSS